MTHIKEFINFTRDILNLVPAPKPGWLKFVINFERMYNEKPDGFDKVFQRFIETYRANLEAPFLTETGVNHEWLKISESDNWGAKGCNGVVMYLAPDNQKLNNYCIPVSEIYSLCLRYYSDKIDVKGIHHELIPSTFMHKLFKCIVDVEPENAKFVRNLDRIKDHIDEFYQDEAPESAVPAPLSSIFESFKSVASGDPSGMAGITAMLAGMGIPQNMIDMASNIPDMIADAKTRMENGENFQEVLATAPIIGDLMKSDQGKNMFEMGMGIISKLENSGLTTDAVTAAVGETLAITDINPADQE